MKLLQLLMRESSLSPWLILTIASISGISNALVLALINMATQKSTASNGGSSIVPFLVVIAVYLLSQRYLLATTIREVDTILHKIRLRIVDKIRNAELLALDQVGRAEIYAGIAKEMQTISMAGMGIVMLAQSGILVLFTLVYVGWLSLMALAFFLVMGIVGLVYYLLKIRAFSEDLHAVVALENELLDTVTHLLDGFKEVKMSEARSAALTEHLSGISASVLEVKGTTTTQIAVVTVFANSAFYFLAAAIVFLLPQLSSAASEVSAQLSAAVLFLIGPINGLVGWGQLYATANVAAENIENLEAALDRHVRPLSKRRARPLVIQKAPFSDITFEGVQFEYVNKQAEHSSFQFGPIDLSISCGQTLFISGGNGSGKSTFLRLLTCLYFPTKGVVRIDGQELSEKNAAAYRNLFSAIFYDYHLFDRLYGLPNIDEKQVVEQLEKLELKGVTGFVDGRFETLDLSTGQKRRLALLVSYLEDKPICVFDEWAAEQDPEFRRHFYMTILPELKARGKTLIIITHDDRYYDMDYVDHLFKFEEGKLVSNQSFSP